MKTFALRSVFVLASLSTGACSTMSPQQRVASVEADIAARPACCRDWREAHVRPLPLEATKFQMDEKADVFLQDGAKAYGVPLQLPVFAKTYGIAISSKTQVLQTERMVFSPRVKFMNERFEVTRSFDEKDLRIRGGNPERTVYINPGNANERFMLIHGSSMKGSYTKQMPVQTVTPVYTGYGVMNWTDGADVEVTVHGSPYGEIEVSVDGLQAPAK